MTSKNIERKQNKGELRMGDNYIKECHDKIMSLDTPNFRDIVKSLEYYEVLRNWNMPQADCFPDLIMIIDGDVSEIVITGLHEMRLIIKYDITPAGNAEMVAVDVKNIRIQQIITKCLKPKTRIKLKGKFKKDSSPMIECIELVQVNAPLLFPHYICSNRECGIDLGTEWKLKRYHQVCPNCGEELMVVHDIHKYYDKRDNVRHLPLFRK